MLLVPGGIACGLPIGDDGRGAPTPRPAVASRGARARAEPPSCRSRGRRRRTRCSAAVDARRVTRQLVREPPGRRCGARPIGFDTVDHAARRPGHDSIRSSWTWKDEDELAEGHRARPVHRGRRRRGSAHWGERAVEHLVLRQPPFDVDWEDWRPDPTWPAPELPPGWDVV